jgi:hypothetical protein
MPPPPTPKTKSIVCSRYLHTELLLGIENSIELGMNFGIKIIKIILLESTLWRSK